MNSYSQNLNLSIESFALLLGEAIQGTTAMTYQQELSQTEGLHSNAALDLGIIPDHSYPPFEFYNPLVEDWPLNSAADNLSTDLALLGDPPFSTAGQQPDVTFPQVATMSDNHPNLPRQGKTQWARKVAYVNYETGEQRDIPSASIDESRLPSFLSTGGLNGLIASGNSVFAIQPLMNMENFLEREKAILDDTIECSNEERALLQGDTYSNKQLLEAPGGACYQHS